MPELTPAARPPNPSGEEHAPRLARISEARALLRKEACRKVMSGCLSFVPSGRLGRSSGDARVQGEGSSPRPSLRPRAPARLRARALCRPRSPPLRMFRPRVAGSDLDATRARSPGATAPTRATDFLASHPRIASVHYPGRATGPQAEIVARQMRGGGGILSLGVDGDAAQTAAWWTACSRSAWRRAREGSKAWPASRSRSPTTP